MFGMPKSTRTTVPPARDDLTTVLRVLRKHTRILANMHHDANESHEEVMRKLGELATKVDTCIEDVRGYRKEQRDISGRLYLVEEHLAKANAS
jgi:Mg2+ and Co2+ transporter CorA